MPEIVADCLIRPAISCFSEEEFNNINHLVLMFFRLAREAHAVVRNADTGLLCVRPRQAAMLA